MALVALLMRPWIKIMKTRGLEPRVLADDLFFYAARTQHASKAVAGMQISKTYFEDIGARVASNKCYMSSTCPFARARIRQIKWGRDDDTAIRVLTSFRDLGTPC